MGRSDRNAGRIKRLWGEVMEKEQMRVIGITGGVGSGKSRVLKHLQEAYGAVIWQLDEVAKELQRAGEPCFERITGMFGPSVVGADGELDRQELGRMVFGDVQKLMQLNAAVHPEVRRQVLRQIADSRKNGTKLFVIESAILPTAGYEDICEEMWYIYTKESVRRERLKVSRGYSDERIDRMIASQPGEEAFRNICSKVIDNSGTFENTKEQIGELL